MLSSATSSMDAATFKSLPSSTNAVESLHRATKQKCRDVLKVALMTTYKVDMACALEHIAARNMIPTSYEFLTPEVKAARAKRSNRARAKRLRDISNYDDEGPPDKRSNFGMFQLVQGTIRDTCTHAHLTCPCSFIWIHK